jgi:OPA family glycerol-3-phosphate transporter-like MFS transporter
MIVSIICTIMFGFGAGMTVFVVAWSVNRLLQSTGWAALVKIASNWFSYDRYGSVMGILSLSFLFGDAIVRLVLGEIVTRGASWRIVFFTSAAILAVIALVNLFVLKEKPEDVGAEPPQVNPDNVYGEHGSKSRPPSLQHLLMPYLTNLSFWLIILLSLGLTIIRETFNLWTPTYLNEVAHLSVGDADKFSLLYPFFGGVSVIAGGYFTDRFTKGKRGGFMAASLALLVVALYVMSRIKPDGAMVPLILISVISLLMMAPYSFLTGVIALDLGGKQGSSTAAGLVDSAGYFGGILSGYGIGTLADKGGWGLAFSALAGASLLTAIAAIVYWRIHERH